MESINRETLAAEIRMIAWGYVLLHLDVNLGTLNILPAWLGYIFMLRALPVLGEAEPSALLLRPLGIVLAGWEGLAWGGTLLGIPFGGELLGVVAAVLSLYFHFQLLTNLAEIAERGGCDEQTSIHKLRTVRTVLMTLLAMPIAWQRFEGLLLAVAGVQIIVAIWICSVLFSLSRSLLGEEETLTQ